MKYSYTRSVLLSLIRFCHDTFHLMSIQIATCQKSGLDDLIPLAAGKLHTRVVIKFNRTCIFHLAALITGNAVHILSADGSALLSCIHHAVDGRRTDPVIHSGCLVVDFLTTGAILLQYNIQKHQALFGDAAAALF